MLDGLDAVNWARLSHAYGPAVDVPGQIRALRSPEADARAKALWQLFGNVFHQGTRYEAAAYAVPFLLEVLAAPDTEDRSGLLELLAAIAIGFDEDWLPAGLPIAEHRRAADDSEAGDFAYSALAAYDAVRAGVPLFRRLLTDPDPAVRTWAAYALAWFPEEASGSLPLLTAVTSDDSAGPDDVVLMATTLVSIGLLGGRPHAAALNDPRALVRWGAAVALANADGPRVGQPVGDELLACAGSSADGRSGVPFLEGDLAGYASLALSQLGESHADATFDTLLVRLSSVSGSDALPVLGEALRLAFPAGALPPGTGFATLDDRQRRLVDVLVQSPETWLFNGVPFVNFSLHVRTYGLPDSRDALQAWAHGISARQNHSAASEA